MDVSKKVVIFCQSYGEIENCLYVAKHNSERNNSVTIVIPGHQDLFTLLKRINERVFHDTINIIYLKMFRPRVEKTIDTPISWAYHASINMIKERRCNRELHDKHLAGLRGTEIYFFTRFAVPYNLYFLRKLHKNNKLVYMHIARKRTFQELDKGYGEGLSKFKPESILDLLRLIRSKIVYGLDMTLVKIRINKVEYFPDRFMAREVDRIISEEESRELLRDLDYQEFKVFDTGNFSIIYFDQRYFYRDELVDTDTFKREINGVFNILRKYFTDEEIGIKYHPGDYTDKTMINIGTVLDSYIPAEFLYNENVKMYLSFTSGSLGNVEKGLAVSLVDIITYRTEEIREQLREAVIRKSHSDILFPKSLEEFEKIVISVREQTKSA